MRIVPDSSFTAQCGATLVEVLIALLVLAVGMLGFAFMQVRGLHSTTEMVQADQARRAVGALYEAIRTYDDRAHPGQFERVLPASLPPCDTQDCSSSQWIDYHLKKTADELTATLPQGALNVSYENGIYQIAVTWDTRRSGGTYTPPTCTAQSHDTEGCFFLTFSME